MNQIFQDYNEIQRLINKIDEEWCQPWDFWNNNITGEEMPTVNLLVNRLRQELINHGGVTEEQIVDPNEIIYYYLDKDVSPDAWQYVFADCLSTLLTNFDEPFGVPANAKERLDIFHTLKTVEKKMYRGFLCRLDANQGGQSPCSCSLG